MKCPHCNQEHRDDALFCENTGKKIEGQLKACTNQSCQSFGKYILPKEAAFCPRCGQKIEASHIGNSSAQNAVNKLHQSPVSKPSPASKPVEPEVVDLFQLGFNYENGRGVTKDLNLALKYYTQAANNGDWRAQNAVNRLHQSPVSKPSPASKPVEPEVVDLFQLGFNYENGRGVTKDLNLALKYYTQAANNGDWRARNAVNRLQEHDCENSTSDSQRAESLFWLGYNYEYGIDVLKNLPLAFHYYTQAANYGHQRAINALERLSLYGTNKIRLSRNEIANRVRKIIVEKMGVADCEVIDSAYFIYDLGADSLDSVELIMEFEKEFNIEILDEEISDNVNTVGDAIDFIQMKINGFR
ncbi:MAG: acyl carrier protein [Bacteroidales bacterium]|nr:acyl carrier protein [Bacteroidales bacterium]